MQKFFSPRLALAAICVTILAFLPAFMLSRAAAEEATEADEKEAQAIEAELARLKGQLAASKTRSNASTVDTALAQKAPPKTPDVKTRDGKLVVGGLIQVWYTQFQRDSRGLFDDRATGIMDTNQAGDNSSFRIRRAEIKFDYKANGFVSAHVMIDPAREANTFPVITDNQAYGDSPFKFNNNVAVEVDRSANDPTLPAGLGNFATIQNLQRGSGLVARVLQDAFINFHNNPDCPGDFDWHHDVQVGQFIPAFGEEGLRSSAELDFAERSFVGMLGYNRDMGAQIHGTWFNDRFQYWTGIFDGAQDYHMSNGQGNNRSDTNDSKDLDFRALVRPLASDCWGDLELGVSTGFGQHGESGAVVDPLANATNGLNRPKTWASRYDAWGYYGGGGVLKGFWTRGEWAWFKDRVEPGTIVDFAGAGTTDFSNTGSGSGLAQGNGHPFSTQGWYVAAGYKLDNPNLCLPGMLQPMEFAFRYQTFQNVVTADLVENSKQDVFYTNVYTAGLNYYLKGNCAKLQANYNRVQNPDVNSPGRFFHPVRNDSFVVNFQVAF